MNDHMYNSFRNYLEEITSQNKQIIVEQARTNELLAQIAAQTKPVELEPATELVSAFQEAMQPPKTTGKGKKKPTKPTEPDNHPDVNWNS